VVSSSLSRRRLPVTRAGEADLPRSAARVVSDDTDGGGRALVNVDAGGSRDAGALSDLPLSSQDHCSITRKFDDLRVHRGAASRLVCLPHFKIVVTFSLKPDRFITLGAHDVAWPMTLNLRVIDELDPALSCRDAVARSVDLQTCILMADDIHSLSTRASVAMGLPALDLELPRRVKFDPLRALTTKDLVRVNLLDSGVKLEQSPAL
jgi:hypothetical protein